MRAKKASKKAAKKAAKKSVKKATRTRSSQRPPASSKALPQKKAGPDVARSRRSSPPVLRPLPVYQFFAGGLSGYVRLDDPGRGFEFSSGVGEVALPTTCREVLSLRHYLARGQGGVLSAREEAACTGKVNKREILFQYDKPGKWPVEASARYELLADGGLDVTFAFNFSKPLVGFEAGVETIVPRTYAGAHVHAGGKWVTASAGPRVKRFYPRNLGAAELIADGRWAPLRMAGIGVSVEPQGYDYPMLVLWEPNLDYAVVFMGLTEECSSVWVNGTDRTVGMGLVGATVKARSSATCRLRAALCRVDNLDDVLPHYRDFVQEARSTRKR
ncbi:MAG: hypothetical protein JXA57_18245 [Armatimonadetes bacterium]|nr:hypothetical protein [Armatimonadota bacterium]